MPASAVRLARVIAADVRIGDELQVATGWRRVVERAEYGAFVEIVCDDPRAGPHAYERNEPVLVRWTVPVTTVAMARQLRRGPVRS